MSTSTRTPRETIELLIRITTEGDRSELADLYSPDVVIDMPFTRPGFPGPPRATRRCAPG